MSHEVIVDFFCSTDLGNFNAGQEVEVVKHQIVCIIFEFVYNLLGTENVEESLVHFIDDLIGVYTDTGDDASCNNEAQY